MFWVFAGSTTRFEQDYRNVAKLVKLPGHDDMKMDIRPVVKAWFEGSESGDWILVLDNADNVFDVYPQNPVTDRTGKDFRDDSLAQFIPHGPKGTVIVTTRDYAVAGKLADTNILSKSKMASDEAMQLFKDRYPNVAGDERSVNHLLKELDYLPLAIVQAAA